MQGVYLSRGGRKYLKINKRARPPAPVLAVHTCAVDGGERVKDGAGKRGERGVQGGKTNRGKMRRT